MQRMILVLGGLTCWAGSAEAQFQFQPGFPQGNPYGSQGQSAPYDPNGFFGGMNQFGGFGQGNQGPFMPNIFNPQNQPLSPYLNLFRNNPAINYYYGVRPGTVGFSNRGFGGAPFIAPGGNRMLFFPQLATAPDPFSTQIGVGNILPPAGHPVVFGNTMGFFPSPFGQAGNGRTGLGGLGNMGSAAPRK